MTCDQKLTTLIIYRCICSSVDNIAIYSNHSALLACK